MTALMALEELMKTSQKSLASSLPDFAMHDEKRAPRAAMGFCWPTVARTSTRPMVTWTIVSAAGWVGGELTGCDRIESSRGRRSGGERNDLLASVSDLRAQRT